VVHDRHVLIAFSRQPSVADFIKRILEDAGYAAIACWSTLDDLERAVLDHRPAALVYEVGFPLAAEWDRFRELGVRPTLADIPLVIATAAPRDLYQRLGIPRALDVFTRPSRHDVDAALQAACERVPRIPDAA
jgi:hypothetical protein